MINNSQDDSTPLHEASQYGHTDVVKTLISHGGDIHGKDKVSKINVKKCFWS